MKKIRSKSSQKMWLSQENVLLRCRIAHLPLVWAGGMRIAIAYKQRMRVCCFLSRLYQGVMKIMGVIRIIEVIMVMGIITIIVFPLGGGAPPNQTHEIASFEDRWTYGPMDLWNTLYDLRTMTYSYRENIEAVPTAPSDRGRPISSLRVQYERQSTLGCSSL